MPSKKAKTKAKTKAEVSGGKVEKKPGKAGKAGKAGGVETGESKAKLKAKPKAKSKAELKTLKAEVRRLLKRHSALSKEMDRLQSALDAREWLVNDSLVLAEEMRLELRDGAGLFKKAGLESAWPAYQKACLAWQKAGKTLEQRAQSRRKELQKEYDKAAAAREKVGDKIDDLEDQICELEGSGYRPSSSPSPDLTFEF